MTIQGDWYGRTGIQAIFVCLIVNKVPFFIWYYCRQYHGLSWRRCGKISSLFRQCYSTKLIPYNLLVHMYFTLKISCINLEGWSRKICVYMCTGKLCFKIYITVISCCMHSQCTVHFFFSPLITWKSSENSLFCLLWILFCCGTAQVSTVFYPMV